MKLFLPVLAALLPLSAMAAPDAPSASPRPAVLMEGLGHHHHPIATKFPEAQRFFDQGLTLLFGFNHEEAIRSFRRAAEIDPRAPMPWWGIALALGTNINMPADAKQERDAYEAVQKALALSKSSPENERAYIQALAERYSGDPGADRTKLAMDYKNAMGDLARRYPDDLDAATLYAESAMDLRPWKLWSLDGQPAEGTEEIVAVLASVLKRDPDHPGANHYYIHAVEASPHPERALPSARRLESLVPAAGHLVHMPAHIYARTGDHDAAARSNAVAARADREYFRLAGNQGMYSLMYYGHNLHFLADSSAWQGRYAEAKRAADQVAALARPHVQEFQQLETFVAMPRFIDLRFHKWDAILKTAEPGAEAPAVRALWLFARGVTLAAQGRTEAAEVERKELTAARGRVPETSVFGGTGLSSARAILELAGTVLDARIAASKGDADAAIENWEKAVREQDAVAYDEPPTWYYPVRESLGAALLLQKRYVEAEKTFRDDLEKNPRNGRSLFGLMESLNAQGKSADAEWIRREFKAAWKNAEGPLRVGDL